MGIDIRIPMGLMFTIFGIILTVYGSFSDKAIYARSLGMNINVGWGVVLLVFGTTMFLLGMRGKGSARSRVEDGDGKNARAAANNEHGK